MPHLVMAGACGRMRMGILFHLLLISLAALVLLPSVHTDTNDVTQGRVFVLGFLEGGGDPVLYLTSQSSSSVSVNVTITNTNPPVMHRFGVPSEKFISLPLSYYAIFHNGTGSQPSAVIVEAESAVSVYGVKKTGNLLGDGFTAIPVEHLGTEYYLASFQPGSSNGGQSEFSQLAIIAIEDDTTVSVHAPPPIAKIWADIALDRYEAYKVQDLGDLTGSFITSDKPIAVFGGACATVPFGNGECQYLIEQIPDVTSLGRHYIVAPPLYDDAPGLGYVVRVIATTDQTSVEIKGTSTRSVVLETKYFEEYIELGGNVTLINADKPVLVVQYTTNFTSSVGPSMTVIPSIQMFSGEVNFVVPSIIDNRNYVSITARCSDGPTLVLAEVGEEIGNETVVPEQRWDRQYASDQMCVYQRWITEPGSYVVAVNSMPSAKFFVLVGGRSGVSYALPVSYQREGDACSSNPCLNGATCFNRQSRYDFMCLCQPGWEGRNCHQATAPHSCEGVVCEHRGRCYAVDEENQTNGEYICLCQYGWGGKHCKDDIVNECETQPVPGNPIIPCNGHGECIDGIGQYQCTCDTGYTGRFCQDDGLPVLEQPKDPTAVIVVAGVIVGCLCFIAVIINVAFITRERCAIRRRRRRHRNQPIEEFRNDPSDSVRRRQRSQNDDESRQQEPSGDTEENTRRASRRSDDDQQRLVGETTERRRGSRRQSGDHQQGDRSRRRHSQREGDGQQQQQQQQEGDRRPSRRRSDLEQHHQQETTETGKRHSRRKGSVSDQSSGNDNAAFENHEET